MMMQERLDQVGFSHWYSEEICSPPRQGFLGIQGEATQCIEGDLSRAKNPIGDSLGVLGEGLFIWESQGQHIFLALSSW